MINTWFINISGYVQETTCSSKVCLFMCVYLFEKWNLGRNLIWLAIVVLRWHVSLGMIQETIMAFSCSQAVKLLLRFIYGFSSVEYKPVFLWINIYKKKEEYALLSNMKYDVVNSLQFQNIIFQWTAFIFAMISFLLLMLSFSLNTIVDWYHHYMMHHYISAFWCHWLGLNKH